MLFFAQKCCFFAQKCCFFAKINNMELKEIQELIKFVAKSGATEVDLELDGVKISIKSPPKKRRGETDNKTTIIHQDPSQVITQSSVSTNVNSDASKSPVAKKIEVSVKENEKS